MTARRRGVVYVVAKAPRPGEAKTRLCPPLQPDRAARLAEAFVLDTLTAVRATNLHARVICRNPAERADLEQRIGGLATVCTQAGTGLGDALESAFRQGLTDGFPAVGVLGADTPTLPPKVLDDAFAALEQGADVSLGPSEDGGYYLLAARALHRALFRQMAWSTTSVARTTIQRCHALGLRTHFLPEWYDVDDPDSLTRLLGHLREAPSSLAPHTRRQLAGHASMSTQPSAAADASRAAANRCAATAAAKPGKGSSPRTAPTRRSK